MGPSLREPFPSPFSFIRMMERSRLDKIEQIYQEAVELPLDKRGSFLDGACAGDTKLRGEVDSLLRYENEVSNFIDSPPALLAAELFDPEGEAPTLIREQISHYRVERSLGRGGMGEVYLATDTRLQRRVALKVLTQSVVGDAERLMRFEREAHAASALNHPNILTVHEFGESDGVHYIASEFVDGVTLRQRLTAARLDQAEALDIAVQVSSALSAAHDAGITHRDIKPENVMIRQDGYIKVLDFGLAKLLQEEPATRGGTEDPTRAMLRTEPGVVMGTDAYMSPEQARGRHVDARTDIWSLGVLVYEMLAGTRPFVGETRADVIVSVLSNEPLPISTNRPEIAPELEWVVAKALSKDVEGRYQTSKELRADLVKIRKRIEFDESLSRSRDRISGADAAIKEESLHSTIETGLKTSAGEHRATGDGPSPTPFFSSRGFETAFQQAKMHKVGSSILATASVALISLGVYFTFIAPAANAQIDSIAVLPFENASGSSDLVYVSDGLSESLIDRFAQLPQLKVVSRKSSFKFRGSDLDLREVASQLGVRAIVTGSVTKLDDDLSIRFEIVDAKDNRQLAGGRYRRRSNDLVNLEHDIAHAAAEQLRLKMTDSQARRLTANATENSDAFRYYLSGLVELNGLLGVRSRALEYFEQAIELDANFAAAHAEIAWIYWLQANASGDPHELMPEARSAVDRALAIEPELAKGHALRAMVYEYEFDWANAERAYKRAIDLSPNLDFARNNYAFFLSVLDRQNEALAQLEEHRTRDPLNQRLFLLQKGIVLVQARKFDQALQVYQQAQTLDPSKPVPDFALGYASGGKGMNNEAVAFYKKAITELGGESEYSQPLVYLAATYARLPEKRGDARAILNRIEAMRGYTSPALLAIVYSALDENDKAMELLEQAYVKRDLLLRFIGTGYEYDGLRSDPRFMDLTKRIGFAR